MHLNKIIAIGIILLSVNNCYAWGDETPILNNETLDINWNPYINESTINTPYTIDDIYIDVFNAHISSPTYISNEQITQCISFFIYKQVWDGSQYIQDDNCFITMEECVTLSLDKNINQYVLPDNWNNQISNGYLIKKYFQDLINSDSQYCSEYNNSDETDKPDIFKTSIEVDVDDGNTYLGETYIQLNEDVERELIKGDIKTGFNTENKGSGGGSGSIYQGLNLYSDTGDESGLGTSFNNMFFILIPLIFIIVVMRFSGRLLK